MPVQVNNINEQLTCRLCNGYLVEATTIVLCMHSFCRSCIIKHIQQQSEPKCPTCKEPLQKDNPFANLLTDQILQTLIYKAIPGLFENELSRRKAFYKDRPEEPKHDLEALVEFEKKLLCPTDLIDVCIEYYPDLSLNDEQNNSTSQTTQSSQLQSNLPLTSATTNSSINTKRLFRYPKRYLRSDASTQIAHIKKWLQHKFDLKCTQKIDILVKNQRLDFERLPDHFTLMEIAYNYGLTNNTIQLSYQVHDKNFTLPKLRVLKRKKLKAKKFDGKKIKRSVFKSNSTTKSTLVGSSTSSTSGLVSVTKTTNPNMKNGSKKAKLVSNSKKTDNLTFANGT